MITKGHIKQRGGFGKLYIAKREFYFSLLCYLRKSLEELKTTKQQEIEVNNYISVIISCTQTRFDLVEV